MNANDYAELDKRADAAGIGDDGALAQLLHLVQAQDVAERSFRRYRSEMETWEKNIAREVERRIEEAEAETSAGAALAVKPGDLVLYKRRGCGSYELGVVKSRNAKGDGWFVWYSGGDTAASTPDDCLLAFGNLASEVVRAHLGEVERDA